VEIIVCLASCRFAIRDRIEPPQIGARRLQSISNSVANAAPISRPGSSRRGLRDPRAGPRNQPAIQDDRVGVYGSGEMFAEILDLLTGLGILLLPLIILAVPGLIRLLPLAVLPIPFAILAAPCLLIGFARLRRRSVARTAPSGASLRAGTS
jgi:hypothetical protein